ncbi:hypothetical protein IAT40_005817 [Kwoniella sp. CBS 6097]
MSVQTPLELLQSFLNQNPAVKYVRYTFIDYAAISRSRFIPVARALTAASQLPESTGAISTFSPLLWALTACNEWVPETGEDGSDHWVPDYTTLHVIPDEPEQAIVLCNVKTANKDKEEVFGYCPRSVLAHVLKKALTDHNLRFHVGFEVEFMLLPNAQAEAPVSTNLGVFHTAPLRLPHSKVCYEVVDALQGAGVGVWGFHSEDAWGQFEISLYPDEPMKAVDTLIFALETIRTLAAKAGYHATTHPYPFEGGSAVGRHINISASQASGEDDVTLKKSKEDQILAGMLKYMRPLSAFLLAGYDSWGGEREKQNGRRAISYATHKCTPIRLNGERSEEKRWELRKPDCLGNPYFQVAAILSAALQGIKCQLPLTQKPAPCFSDGPMPEEARREAGITQDLPRDLEEAIGCLKAERGLFESYMGEMCLKAYIKNKEAEVKVCDSLVAKERRLKIVANI